MAKDRSEQAEDTRTIILDTAARLFSQNGYASTSMREICDASGFTKPTLYYHFTNKEGLCKALLDVGLEEQNQLAEDVLKKTIPLPQKLKEFARHTFQSARKHRDYVVFYFDFFSGPDATGMQQKYVAVVNENNDAYTEIIRQGQKTGVFRGDMEPEMASSALQGAVMQALGRNVRFGIPELTDELADMLVDLVIYGLATPSDKASSSSISSATQ